MALVRVVGAQQVQGGVSVFGGSATDVRGISSRAVSVTPSLTIVPDPHAAFEIAATGTRFDHQQWAASLDGSAALRAPIARYTALTLSGGADAVTTSYDLSYTTARALPALEIGTNAFTGYIGGSFALASTTMRAPASVPTPQLGPFSDPVASPERTTERTTASRTANGFVFGASSRGTTSDGEAITASVREEHFTVDAVPTVDRSVSVSVAQGRTTLSGSFGERAERNANASFGSGALSIALTQGTALTFAAGSYPANRLLGTPGGRFLNLGMSLRTARGAPQLPAPEGAPAARAGMTRLAVRAPDASTVEVLGDFTNWKPIQAHRAPNGVWYADLRIPPGQYRYAFRANGNAWLVPDGAVTVDDDFGGKSAWLVVSPSPAAR